MLQPSLNSIETAPRSALLARTGHSERLRELSQLPSEHITELQAICEAIRALEGLREVSGIGAAKVRGCETVRNLDEQDSLFESSLLSFVTTRRSV